ncbi:MAG: hypothetical protein KIT16_13665 [Rhodospirillaceae bacterium]|nr:hypothetical protein [Rhodospirillaceae bacterium]
MSNLDAIDHLRHALAATPRLRVLAQARLVALPGRGIAHDHYAAEGAKLDRARVVLRVPRVSQWGMPPAQQLAYEAVAFARAEPSRATPPLPRNWRGPKGDRKGVV